MAGVEFGRRTRAHRHTRLRAAGRARPRMAPLIALLTLLSVTGAISSAIADAGHAAAEAASRAGAAGNRLEPAAPGSGDPTPAEPDPTAPPSTEPPTGTPTPTTPPESPEPSTGSPTPEPGASTPTPAAPPTTGDPDPTWSSRPPSTAPRPPQPGQARLGVLVSTGDITLGGGYWSTRGTTTDLQVTIRNTGETRQLLRLRYTLPPGVTDAGTAGCAVLGGGTYRCAAWSAEAGAQFTTRIRVLVDADAWQRMPLSGSVQVTATDPARPDGPEVTDDEGFAVLFPPGPPAAGLTLAADEVRFDVTGQPATLVVRLGNSGTSDANGSIEVTLPAGVTVPTPPPGCRPVAPSPRDPAPTDPERGGTAHVGCELGRVQAGGTATVRMPVVATPAAQRMAPLSGAVAGALTSAQGRTGRMQMSFRITAAAAAQPAGPDGAAPTGSQGLLPMVRPVSQPDGGLTGVKRTAIGLIVVSGLLVVLALTLAAVTLRRHSP